jgi:hypothetical protein
MNELLPLVCLALATIQVGGALWAGTDANERGSNGLLWAIVVLFTGVVGLVLYLVLRSAGGNAPRPATPPICSAIGGRPAVTSTPVHRRSQMRHAKPRRSGWDVSKVLCILVCVIWFFLSFRVLLWRIGPAGPGRGLELVSVYIIACIIFGKLWNGVMDHTGQRRTLMVWVAVFVIVTLVGEAVFQAIPKTNLSPTVSTTFRWVSGRTYYEDGLELVILYICLNIEVFCALLCARFLVRIYNYSRGA